MMIPKLQEGNDELIDLRTQLWYLAVPQDPDGRWS